MKCRWEASLQARQATVVAAEMVVLPPRLPAVVQETRQPALQDWVHRDSLDWEVQAATWAQAAMVGFHR